MAYGFKTAVALQAAALAYAQQTYTNSDGDVYTITQDLGTDTPLASKSFEYPNLPWQADTGSGPRGTMQGYNLCNSTNAGQDSLCSTIFVNDIEDFCLWGAPEPDSVVGDIEGEMVAYCTSDKHNTRVIPEGALQGVQFMKTPGYVQVVGQIDQTALGLQADDYGGEEDPHGADFRGNPLGSLMYSSAFGKGNLSDYQQVHEWSFFIGSGTFCFKACDPSGENAARLCEHVYDRVGCTYNAPADYTAINGTFQSCEGDNQLPVGVYVTNGETSTWAQPAESLGEITSIPYTPSIPASSQCSTYTSSSLWTEMASASAAASSAASSGAKGSKAADESAAASASSGDDAQASASAGSAKKDASETDTEGSGALVSSVAGLALALVAGLAVVLA